MGPSSVPSKGWAGEGPKALGDGAVLSDTTTRSTGHSVVRSGQSFALILETSSHSFVLQMSKL